MKTILTAICLLGMTWMTAEAQPAVPEGYKLVWHDEFDTDGRPASHWNYERGFVRNHELQWYQPDNAEVRDGCLIITGRIDSIPNPDYDPGSDDWRKQRQAARYSSSCLTTSDSFCFRYGRLEVRARIPVNEGAWPAIWTLGNRWEWPANGELDLMEFYRRRENGEPIILANACWQNPHSTKRWDDVWDDSKTPYTHFTDKDPLWASKFHIWHMDWDPEYIRMYLDGELLNEIPLSQAENGGGSNHDVNPFSNDIEGFGAYILLNLAIGSTGGTPDDASFPLRYEIDYVRVYQRQ